jgi:hypothetical protein
MKPVFTEPSRHSTAGMPPGTGATGCCPRPSSRTRGRGICAYADEPSRRATLKRRIHERSNQAYALRLLGEIAARRQPPEGNQAEAYYRQALGLAVELGMRPLQAHCHRGLGTLYATTGQREQARAELDTAIEMYHIMDMTFWLPQAEAALAQVEGR